MEELNRKELVLLSESSTTVLIKVASHRETDQAPDPVSAMCRPETKTQASSRRKQPFGAYKTEWLRSARQAVVIVSVKGALGLTIPRLSGTRGQTPRDTPGQIGLLVLYEEKRSKETRQKSSVYA